MSMLRWLEMPFRYTTHADFEKKLGDWLGDVFYEILPAAGFETREEQIYTAYRMAKALCQRQVLLAEAGSGTGKTFAYLLSSLCYARLIGKPVILSSANTALQQQLVAPDGDIATLARHLGIDIDARLAKDPSNYLCQSKAKQLRHLGGDSEANQRLLSWAEQTKLGDRSEIADVSDELWQRVAWDKLVYCDRCRHRGYCQAAISRKHYAAAQDFIVCSHDVFFTHLWSRSERVGSRQLPLLPDFAAVIFDEGHLVEYPALYQLGTPLRPKTILDIIESIDVYSLYYHALMLVPLEELAEAAHDFFVALSSSLIPHAESARWAVDLSPGFLQAARRLRSEIDIANDSIAIAMELHSGTDAEQELHIYGKRFDTILASLELLIATEEQAVCWWEPAQGILWTLPQQFNILLGQELTSKRLPLIFTSATLQADGSFTGLKQLLGIPQAQESQVGTSFDLTRQVCAYVPPFEETEDDVSNSFNQRIEHCLSIIATNGGSALVLLKSQQELKQWQAYLEQRTEAFPYRLLWQGSQDRGRLLEQFKADLSSVLIGIDFWEGIDIPGSALSLIVVFSLPYPADDPLLLARQQQAEQAGLDPRTTVAIPAMLIKLRQGYGRLIRSATDQGILAVLDTGPGERDRQLVLDALPRGVIIHSDFQQALTQIGGVH